PLDALYQLGVEPTGLNVVALTALFVLAFQGTALALRLLTAEPGRFARVVNFLMSGVLGLATFVTVIPLVFILTYLVIRGVEAINWEFFTQLPGNPGQPGGMANALYGSAMLVGLASLLAIPIGLLAAIYLSENRRSRLSSALRFIGELLGGVP